MNFTEIDKQEYRRSQLFLIHVLLLSKTAACFGFLSIHHNWISYLLSYLLTPWSRVLLEKLGVCQLDKKFPAFYGTRRIITAFTSARHLSLSWATSNQSTSPHPTSWRSILILSSYLRLGPKWCLSFRFPHQNPVNASLLPHTRYMPRQSHSSRFYQPINWISYRKIYIDIDYLPWTCPVAKENSKQQAHAFQP
jgi:purine-cytosine permease-like protein